jgi:hypothetical protein
MTKKKRPGIFIISVRKQNQSVVLPILEHLRKTDYGISRTICRLLVEFKENGYQFDSALDGYFDDRKP